MTRLHRQLPAQAEWQIQMAVVDHLKLRSRPDVFWFGVPNGGYVMDARVVAKLKACGLRPGVPDIVVIGKDRTPLGLELKRAVGGRQSLAQECVQDAWEASGGVYRLAAGQDEALAILADWGALR